MDKAGSVWFTELHGNSIGRLEISKAQAGRSAGFQEFPIPAKDSHPHGIAVDKDGGIWFTEMGGFFQGKFRDRIGRVVP
ncbi:MAG: hypothetical protein HZA13_09280 [Nitrospirae bacterium]|nr:hypothetical protein [Nitrospirota bacterium]